MYKKYILLLVLIYSGITYLIYRKLRARTLELDNLNELKRSFIDADDSLIFLKDNNLRYVFVNKAMVKLYNKNQDYIIGKRDIDLVEKDFADANEESDLEVLRMLRDIRSEVKWGDRILRINKFPVKLLGGKYGVGGYIGDITNTVNELRDNRDKLSLILDSTAEGIFGLDLDGNCSFCNKSSLEILGYQNENELIGKNMHFLIHHSYSDGRPMDIEDCKIMQTIENGQGTHADDEVFWTSQGQALDVEYWSYPQFRDGKLVGAVVTFLDISEKKKRDEEILYLSYHDSLTGLYNRTFFEEEIKRLDREKMLPLSVIMGDANSLKLTNDVFGHSAGDELLINISNAFKKVCRQEDIIARIGGDEFVILLPQTKEKDAENIVKRIREAISREKVLAVRTSISMGIATKNYEEEDISDLIEDAEIKMYQDKSTQKKTSDKKQLETLLDYLYKGHPREKLHSENVAKISREIGGLMGLSRREKRKLHDAAYLHDIGKLVLDDQIIENGPRTDEEIREYRQHSLVGYRILNSFNKTLDLADVILALHEHWDGSGFPKGLKGSEIPLLARIIVVAENYDSKTNKMNKTRTSREDTIKAIKAQAGKKYDPEVVDAFLQLTNRGRI